MKALASRSSSGVGKLARWLLSLLPETLVAPILMGEAQGNRWIVGSSRYACWLGSYEPDKQRLISQSIQPGTIFYDVGANVGFYSLLAARLVGNGKVFAFEPLPTNLLYLRRHLKLNGITNTEVFSLAVADREGSGAFRRADGGGSGGFRLGTTRSMGHLAPDGDITVHTTTLDLLLHQGKILPPNYIKMDIEGAELRALKGAEQCIRQYRPQIFLATHGTAIHSGCCQLLEDWGYECQILELTVYGYGEVVANPTR